MAYIIVCLVPMIYRRRIQKDDYHRNSIVITLACVYSNIFQTGIFYRSQKITEKIISSPLYLYIRAYPFNTFKSRFPISIFKIKMHVLLISFYPSITKYYDNTIGSIIFTENRERDR